MNLKKIAIFTLCMMMVFTMMSYAAKVDRMKAFETEDYYIEGQHNVVEITGAYDIGAFTNSEDVASARTKAKRGIIATVISRALGFPIDAKGQIIEADKAIVEDNPVEYVICDPYYGSMLSNGSIFVIIVGVIIIIVLLIICMNKKSKSAKIKTENKTAKNKTSKSTISKSKTTKSKSKSKKNKK